MKLIANGKTSAGGDVVSHDESAATNPISGTWGWLPILSLTSAAGVFLLALAYNAGRFEEPGAFSALANHPETCGSC